MISSISWYDFAKVLLFLIVAYYITMGLIFYRKELIRKLFGKGRSEPDLKYDDENAGEDLPELSYSDSDEEETEDAVMGWEKEMDDAERLAGELRMAMAIVFERGYDPEEMKIRLKAVLLQYNFPPDSQVRSAAHTLIQSELESNGVEQLPDQELETLWSDSR